MTTYVAFTPSQNATPPFTAQFILDQQVYSGAATWNLYAQRWYLTLTDPSGSVAWSGALVGSPLGTDIYLAPGLFQTSTLLFREDTGNFEQNP